MVDVQEVKHKAVSGAIGYVFRSLANQGISLLANLALTYLLSPADFGVYFVVTAIIGIFTFLSDVGLAAALVQKKEAPTKGELRTTFTIQQGLAVGIFLLILILTPLWKTRGLNTQGIFLLYAVGFSFVMASLKTIPSILLERKLEFSKLVLPQIIENITFYGVVVFLAWRGLGIQSYTVGVLLRDVVGVAYIYYLQSWPIGFALEKAALKRLLNFGVKFQLNDLLARIKDDLLIVFIAGIVGPQNMGYVSWAKKWSTFPYQLGVNSMLSLVFPSFSRLQEHPVALRKAIEKSLFFISLCVFPLLAIMSGMAEPMLHAIPRLMKWAPALPSLYFFCISIAWGTISTPLTNTLNALGAINKTLRLMIMWTVLNWTLTPIAVWLLGFQGVALAGAIIAPTSLLTIYMLKKTVQISFVENVWRQALAAVLCFGMLWWLRGTWQTSIWMVGVGGMLGLLVFALVFVGLGSKKLVMELRSLRSTRNPTSFPI